MGERFKGLMGSEGSMGSDGFALDFYLSFKGSEGSMGAGLRGANILWCGLSGGTTCLTLLV